VSRPWWQRLVAGAGGVLFVLSLLTGLGLVYHLAERHALHFDWTYRQRSSLSEASQRLLQQISGPIQVLAFAREDPALRRQIELLVNRYRRQRADIELSFVNPDLQPDLARDLGVRSDGELLVTLGQRQERVATLSEQALSNALRRAASGERRTLVFVVGHGERSARGDGNFDLGRFGEQLAQQGYRIEQWDPAEVGPPAPGSAVLVLADPRTPPLPGTVEDLVAYLDQGGNLLWLGEPPGMAALSPLGESLGVAILPGVVLDRSASVAGFDDPQFAIARRLADHAITRDLQGLAVLPTSAGLDAESIGGWQAQPLLATVERLSWTETGPADGASSYDAATLERPGPIALGVALERPLAEGQQRAAVTGDADFLANAYLGLGANLELGLNLVSWLSGDDDLIAINPMPAPDTRLPLSERALSGIGLLFLLAVPLALLAAGMAIWWWRRR